MDVCLTAQQGLPCRQRIRHFFPSTSSTAHVALLHPPAAGMLAPDGRCKTLDAAADGYVRSEAALAIVLRAIDSLTAAATEGGVGGVQSGMGAAVLLLGSTVNQDGRSSSLTAPNGPSQQALFRAAASSASLPASRVNLLSMHGTGTGRDCAGCVSNAGVWWQGSGNASELSIRCCCVQADNACCPLAMAAGTSLGDPIEVGAALAVLMPKRKGKRCTCFLLPPVHPQPACPLCSLVGTPGEPASFLICFSLQLLMDRLRWPPARQPSATPRQAPALWAWQRLCCALRDGHCPRCCTSGEHTFSRCREGVNACMLSPDGVLSCWTYAQPQPDLLAAAR